MKATAIHIIVLICFIQVSYSQEEDGVVALDIPVRNSLMFNRYVVHPTFSFVREQNKYITATNKREMVGVDDAPNTFFFNYSGRIKENMGAGIGVFQQNYGVLTTFGAIINFAYNARIQEDSNFTFGLNVGAYKSGLNSNKVITNFDDPALDNIPSNFLLTVNPGLNYGTGFMDFGLSYNNLITYNFSTSALLEENPIRGLQGHIMYTGYFDGYGFFGDSKLSMLARSEFQKETTIISGLVMITVPKGIWAQVGYNTKYGASGGFGVNITSQIAVEYNYEKSFGGLSDFGASHEITLAYRFKNNNYYNYSRDDELAGLINIEKKEKKKETAKTPEKTITQEKEELAVVEQTRLASEEKARLKSEEQAKLLIEEQTRLASEEQTRIALEEKARLAAEEQTRLIAEEQAMIVAEEQTRLALEEKARLESEEQAKLLVEEQTRLAAEEQVKLDTEKEVKENLIKNPSDAIGKSISELTLQTNGSSKIQAQLIIDLEAAVAIKESDLKDLKEENDLSEQNIYVEPKPFKSISKENEEIEFIRINLDEIIIRQKKKITQLESLLQEREILFKDPLDEINLYYKNQIDILKSEQEKAIRSRESLVSSLEQISIATDFERKRRIKRAAYDNDQDRYAQDRKTLNNLKKNTSLSTSELTLEDLDFGRELNNNIQIIKNVQHAESGYYLVLAVHSDVKNRDKFLVQVISSGNKEVDFFFDVNTSEYYIYSKKFNNINETERALTSKLDKPYNEKINIIKIEN